MRLKGGEGEHKPVEGRGKEMEKTKTLSTEREGQRETGAQRGPLKRRPAAHPLVKGFHLSMRPSGQDVKIELLLLILPGKTDKHGVLYFLVE